MVDRIKLLADKGCSCRSSVEKNRKRKKITFNQDSRGAPHDQTYKRRDKERG